MKHFYNMLAQGKTQFHVVEQSKAFLKEHGFKLIDMQDTTSLVPGERYMISPFSSALFAFVANDSKNIRIAAGHTDFPMLKLKPQPDISKKGYIQVNVEPYGGLIAKTWYDRPLGLAGKVVTAGDDFFKPHVHLYDSKKPLFVIPSLAPHLSRGAKEGEPDMQKELIPIMGCEEAPVEHYIINYISKELDIAPEDILDYDLYLYIHGEPVIAGAKDELLLSPRIDNISSVSAICEALCSDSIKNCIAFGAFFDNEEVGSRSKQGADSVLLQQIIRKIAPDYETGADIFNISVDVAHATHPNYTEKSDITNDIVLGGGVVLKTSASQRYVTDSEAGAVITAICRNNNIRLQKQVNRSGMPGGQTLGPIMSSYIPAKSVDIGIPLLAMHSACETAHTADYLELKKLLTCYFEY